MCKDLKNNRMNRQKIDARIDGLDKRLSKILSQKDFLRLIKITKQHRDVLFEKIRNRQRKEFNDLRKVVLQFDQGYNFRSMEADSELPTSNAENVVHGSVFSIPLFIPRRWS